MLEAGRLVRSAAGHDSGEYYIVLGLSGGRVLLVNGKSHPLERPKRKNPVHIVPTSLTIPLFAGDVLPTNKRLRRELSRAAGLTPTGGW